jgi:Protein of unknown function (DUF3237)
VAVIPEAPVPGLEPAFTVRAEILPGGADWQVVRPDGAVEIDTRYSPRTINEGYVHFRTSGVRSGPPSVLAALLAGEAVDPGTARSGVPGSRLGWARA